MHETVEATAVVDGALDRLNIVIPGPDEFRMPEGGLNIRLNDTVLGMEARLHDYKRDAMLAFVRANKLNRVITSGGRNPKIGVITTGKSYLDVRQALDELGIDEVKCNDWGLRIDKIACPWPIGKPELMEFAKGLDLIIVVEEKRSLIEVQVREELYGTANQPTVIGKKDEQGNWLFPVKGALDSNDVAICIGERLLKYVTDENLKGRVARLKEAQAAAGADPGRRRPHSLFLLRLPAQLLHRGAGGLARLRRHRLPLHGAVDGPLDARLHPDGRRGRQLDRRGAVLEDAACVPEHRRRHLQPLRLHGAPRLDRLGRQRHLQDPLQRRRRHDRRPDERRQPLGAEDRRRRSRPKAPSASSWSATSRRNIRPASKWPEGITFHHRDDLQAVQKELREIPGCTVLIYDQTCAAEKRRRRKRGTFPDPEKRVIINELVCEGCGDCGVKSNCVSVQPLETEFGRKRTIDQSSCNKDYSCVKGFCPSFVTVHGAQLKKGKGVARDQEVMALPEPAHPKLGQTYNIIVTGVGGTGIVTIGGILGMAAHLEGKGVGVIDMAGLAQKGGAVYSHMRIAERPEDIHAIRVAAGGADLVLGGDIVVAGNKKVLSAVKPGTAMVINTVGVPARATSPATPTSRCRPSG